MGNTAQGMAAWITRTRFRSRERGKYLATKSMAAGTSSSRMAMAAVACGARFCVLAPMSETRNRSRMVAPMSNRLSGTAQAPSVVAAFGDSVRKFERIWYGEHSVDEQQAMNFVELCERIANDDSGAAQGYREQEVAHE